MFLSRTSLKIAVWYGLSFLAASILIFVLTGFFLAKLLQSKDRDLLRTKFHVYEEIIGLEGTKGLRSGSGNTEVAQSQQFYVRVADEDGKTLFLHVPEDHSHDSDGQSIKELENFLNRHETSSWIVFPGEHYGDDIELVSGRLKNGSYLQIGKDTEDREAFLQDYLRAFWIVFFPLLLAAVAFGLLFSSKLLAPIRWLSETVEGIRLGRTSERVSLRGNNDELDRLSKVFNQMLDQNELLIRSMTEALDNVAHDLRTPVMHLRSGIEMALEKKLSVQQLKETMSDALENSEVVLNILNATMDISEAKAGTLHLNREQVEVDQMLKEIVELYSYPAEERKIKIECQLSGGAKVFGDRTRLLQAVANLIDNAIKYSPENSSVMLTSKSSSGLAEIAVSDLGKGIGEEEREKIWERFYRGDSSRSGRGLGLGLSLVRAIAQAHMGAVAYQDRPGGGSTFRLLLPLAQEKI